MNEKGGVVSRVSGAVVDGKRTFADVLKYKKSGSVANKGGGGVSCAHERRGSSS